MSKDNKGKETIIKTAFADVNKFGQNGQFDKAMKAVNRILGVAPDDPTALHCKVVCLIQLSKFDEAYRFIEKNRLADILIFEKAYCEYRLNKPQQALTTIDDANVNPLPPNLKELRTQVLYRLERYSECFDLYKEIIKNTDDDYEEERRTNLSAVAAQLVLEGTEIPDLPEVTYEQLYNSACTLANQKYYAEAEHKLRICEKMCRDMLEEDGATEEEMREELDAIRVQIAYCMQMQGKQKESGVIYAECLRNKPKDPTLVAVASNNTIVINKDHNVFDSKKKIRAALSEAAEPKLKARQKCIIAVNNCLLALFASGSESVHQLCQKLVQIYPATEFKALLLRCAQFCKDKKIKEAIELLQNFATQHEENRFEIQFIQVHLHLTIGNRKEAIGILESLGDAKYKPGIVSALVTLYLGIDNKTKASQTLKDAVEFYKRSNSNSGDLSDMWRQAAAFHLRGGAPQTAASSLEELSKLQPNDMRVLAQLVIAYAQFDCQKALEASKKLPKLEALSAETDIAALESANWIMSTRSAKKAVAAVVKGDASPDTPVVKKKRNNRKRRGKLPKNYNAEATPDPERWLPKYERTGFRKKRDRRAKDIIKGSQGMSTGAAEQYDMSNRVNLGKNSPVTPVVQETTPGPRQQHRKGGHRKKKGGRF